MAELLGIKFAKKACFSKCLSYRTTLYIKLDNIFEISTFPEKITKMADFQKILDIWLPKAPKNLLFIAFFANVFRKWILGRKNGKDKNSYTIVLIEIDLKKFQIVFLNKKSILLLFPVFIFLWD